MRNADGTTPNGATNVTHFLWVGRWFEYVFVLTDDGWSLAVPVCARCRKEWQAGHLCLPEATS